MLYDSDFQECSTIFTARIFNFLIVGPGTCVHNVRIRLKNKILNRNKHKNARAMFFSRVPFRRHGLLLLTRIFSCANIELRTNDSATHINSFLRRSKQCSILTIPPSPRGAIKNNECAGIAIPTIIPDEVACSFLRTVFGSMAHDCVFRD